MFGLCRRFTSVLSGCVVFRFNVSDLGWVAENCVLFVCLGYLVEFVSSVACGLCMFVCFGVIG